MKTTKVVNKGCCATCVTSLVWNAERDGQLIAFYTTGEQVIGTLRSWGPNRSPRAYCNAH